MERSILWDGLTISFNRAGWSRKGGIVADDVDEFLDFSFSSHRSDKRVAANMPPPASRGRHGKYI